VYTLDSSAAGQEMLPLPGRTISCQPREAGNRCEEGRLLVTQPVDFAGDPHLRDIDPVHTGTPTDATQLIATDPRSGAGAIHRLLRQQEEPPRRWDI
jgi:hypothetical protein